jgi:hypothetical protein
MMIIGIDPFIIYGAIAVCLIFLLRRRFGARVDTVVGYVLLAIVAIYVVAIFAGLGMRSARHWSH